MITKIIIGMIDNYFIVKERKPLFLADSLILLLKLTLVHCISLSELKYKFRGFVAERKGEREDMQDAHVILDDFLAEFDNKPTEM